VAHQSQPGLASSSVERAIRPLPLEFGDGLDHQLELLEPTVRFPNFVGIGVLELELVPNVRGMVECVRETFTGGVTLIAHPVESGEKVSDGPQGGGRTKGVC
jgi:hypothetical protein